MLAFDGSNPAAVSNSPAVGSATVSSRRDHVHAGTFYEQGVWTPALADATLNGSGEGQGYSLQKGFYQRVGNWVTFIGWLTVTNKGSLTAGEQANIVGLPYASSSTASAQSATVVIGDGGGWALAAAGQSVTGAIPVGGKSHFYLKLWDATTGVTTLTIAETTASLDFIFSGNYLAA